LGNEFYQSPALNSFNQWFSQNNMKRIPHKTLQYENCLFESVANGVLAWIEKQVELRYCALEYGQGCKQPKEQYGERRCGRDLKKENVALIIMGK
jgi:hypothetical protein